MTKYDSNIKVELCRQSYIVYKKLSQNKKLMNKKYNNKNIK